MELFGLELIRFREQEMLKKMQAEEEMEEREEQRNFIREMDRVAPGFAIRNAGKYSDSEETRMEEKRMERIDKEGGFAVIDGSGELVRHFDNLAQACACTGRSADDLLLHIALRKPYNDLLVVEEREYMDAWMEGRKILFDKGNDGDGIGGLMYVKPTEVKVNEQSDKEKRCEEDEEEMAMMFKKPVRCVETGKTYNSIREASVLTSIYELGISKSIQYGCSVLGLHFESLESGGFVPQPIGRMASKKELDESAPSIRVRSLDKLAKLKGISPVVIEETGNIYPYKTYVARLFKVSISTIFRCIDKKELSVRGYHIRKLTDEERGRIMFGESFGSEKWYDFTLVKNRNGKRPVSVVRLDTGKVYASMNEFSKDIGTTQSAISAAVSRGIFNVKGIPFVVQRQATAPYYSESESSK